MPLALQSIFNKVRLQSEQRHNVRMSCFQLYREQAFDLLDSAQSKVAPSLTRSKTHHHILSGLTSLRMRWSKLVRNYIHRHEIPSVATAKQLGRLHCHASHSQNLPCGFKFGREQKYRFNTHFFHCLSAWAVHVLALPAAPVIQRPDS
jgi:hypothetical protein